MATDYFGRAINDGDVIWIPATVASTTDTTITCSPNNAAQHVAVTIPSGTGGGSTNPLEGDRPPK